MEHSEHKVGNVSLLNSCINLPSKFESSGEIRVNILWKVLLNPTFPIMIMPPKPMYV